MTPRPTWEYLDSTEDTGDPVIQGRIGESHADIILDAADGVIRVAHIVSENRGDMKRILDAAVRQTGCNTVYFLNPLDELKEGDRTRLIDRLEGFEKATETHHDPDGDTVKIEIYKGTWEP